MYQREQRKTPQKSGDFPSRRMSHMYVFFHSLSINLTHILERVGICMGRIKKKHWYFFGYWSLFSATGNRYCYGYVFSYFLNLNFLIVKQIFFQNYSAEKLVFIWVSILVISIYMGHVLSNIRYLGIFLKTINAHPRQKIVK